MKFWAWSCLFLTSLAVAQVNIQWLKPPPSEIKNNIDIALKTYSGFADCESISPLELAQQRQSLGTLLLDSFHAFGYFDTQFITLERVSLTQCNDWSASVLIGERAKLVAINVETDSVLHDDPVIAKRYQALTQHVGKPFSQKLYTGFKDDIYSLAIARGYFDIAMGQSQIVVAQNNRDITLRYGFEFGDRYVIDALELPANTINQALLNNIIELELGEPYALERINEMRSALNRSGYFATVQIRPDLANRRDGKINLIASLTEKPKHQVEYGIGFSTDIGPRASVAWKRARLNDSGHSIRLSSKVSAPEQQISATYKVPLANPNREYINYQLGLERTDFNDREALSLSLGATRFFPVGHFHDRLNDWHASIFTRYTYSDFTQADVNANTKLWYLGGSLHYLQTDDMLFPSTGERHDLTLETAQNSLLSDFTVYRLTAQTKWLRPLSSDWTWLGIWRAGWMDTDDFARTPSEQRFYLGGDQSIRGFGYKDIAPRDASGALLGGEQSVSTQQELIYQINDSWGIAGFFDAAQISYNAQSLSASGVGLGAIWRSPLGPVRLYAARGSSTAESTWRLHILLGPVL